ncbi:hypothetical protein BMS3Abin15_00520 [bacterium BMS3Abin15]|nr:hypothetical protein BMS3Abin15_00520 [bacterium BMS3Abin15]HDZ61875.1 hypothetical protein [Nitrospirota bacterium]
MENKDKKALRFHLGKAKIKDFFTKYEAKIALAIGLVLVAVISFEVGTLQGQNWQQKPLIIEKPIQAENSSETAENLLKTQKLASESVSQELVAGDITQKDPSKSEVNPSNLAEAGCVFVGSKNSDKYHKTSCSWATRIKPENRVCFKDMEGAKNKGYVPASCMKK